jgi:putative oxidoreductase
MSISELISPLMGRLALAWFFLGEAWWRMHNWEGTIALMQMRHISYAPLFLVLAILVLVLGGFSLAVGYLTRPAALVLFGFTVVVTLAVHDYWKIANAFDRSADYDIFIRNVAIAGGLLLLVGMGPGPFAFDNPPRKKR